MTVEAPVLAAQWSIGVAVISFIHLVRTLRREYHDWRDYRRLRDGRHVNNARMEERFHIARKMIKRAQDMGGDAFSLAKLVPGAEHQVFFLDENRDPGGRVSWRAMRRGHGRVLRAIRGVGSRRQRGREATRRRTKGQGGGAGVDGAQEDGDKGMAAWSLGTAEGWEKFQREAEEARAKRERAEEKALLKKVVREVVTDVLQHELRRMRRPDSDSPDSPSPGATTDNGIRPGVTSTDATTPDTVGPHAIASDAVHPNTTSSSNTLSSSTSRTSTISIDARDYIRDELRSVIKEELRRNRKSYRLKIWIIACTDLILDFGHRDENGHCLGFWGRRRGGMAGDGGSMVVYAGAAAAAAPIAPATGRVR